MATLGRWPDKISADYATESETGAKKDNGDGPPQEDMEEACRMEEQTLPSRTSFAMP